MAARPAPRGLVTEPGKRPTPRLDEPVELVLYHDVFCSWCYVADQRLDVLRQELGSQVTWALRGYPLRPDDRLPDKKQRQVLARHFRRVAKEAEGRGVVPELWTGRDPPSSSRPPLIALEAALLQGEEAQRELLTMMRKAAFIDGINVARRDVQLELAARAGLDVPSFLEELDDPASARSVDQGCEEAEAHGIKGVPALVIGGEWLMQGAREVDDYRQVIEKYLHERTLGSQLRVLH